MLFLPNSIKSLFPSRYYIHIQDFVPFWAQVCVEKLTKALLDKTQLAVANESRPGLNRKWTNGVFNFSKMLCLVPAMSFGFHTWGKYLLQIKLQHAKMHMPANASDRDLLL